MLEKSSLNIGDKATLTQEGFLYFQKAVKDGFKSSPIEDLLSGDVDYLVIAGKYPGPCGNNWSFTFVGYQTASYAQSFFVKKES